MSAQCITPIMPMRLTRVHAPCYVFCCSVSAGDLPSLQQLRFDAATLQRCSNDTSAAGARLHGGESEALRRLTDFITHFTLPSTSSSSASSSGRKGGAQAEAPNFCCKISPWLALGCLSPRQLYEQLQQKLSGQEQKLRAAGQGSDTGVSVVGVCMGCCKDLAARVSDMPLTQPCARAGRNAFQHAPSS